MVLFLKNFFTRNLALKVLSLILALLIWVYIVNELNHGSSEDLRVLRKIIVAEKKPATNINVKTRR